MPENPPKKWLTSWDSSSLSELSSEMQASKDAGTPLLLDLSERAIARDVNPSAVRLNTSSVQVLTNLLVGRFRDVEIQVRLPETRGLNLQLARGGLFFGLSNRSNVSWATGEPPGWNRVSAAWVQPFHLGDARMRRDALAMRWDLNREDWVIRAAFQRYLLSVIHPHKRPAVLLRDELNQIARRWLSGRLHVEHGSALVTTLIDCAELFYEIIVNVPDHAGIGLTEHGASLGQLYATLGGGRDSYNRLNFSAIDNGVGLPRRVNEKFLDRQRTAQEALLDSVTGALPRLVGGRGVGLANVHRIANNYSAKTKAEAGKSHLRIVTNSDTPGSGISLEWDGDSGAPHTSEIPGLAIQGTLVWVSLGLDRRTDPTDVADQLELTFEEPAFEDSVV